MKLKNIGKFLFTIFLLFIIYIVYSFYNINNFNEFVLSKSDLRISTFSRDKEVKYLGKSSYKITSEDYNDAMFSQKIKVKKDTSYKVSCMIKTKDVVSKKNVTGSGAFDYEGTATFSGGTIIINGVQVDNIPNSNI